MFKKYHVPIGSQFVLAWVQRILNFGSSADRLSGIKHVIKAGGKQLGLTHDDESIAVRRLTLISMINLLQLDKKNT